MSQNPEQQTEPTGRPSLVFSSLSTFYREGYLAHALADLLAESRVLFSEPPYYDVKSTSRPHCMCAHLDIQVLRALLESRTFDSNGTILGYALEQCGATGSAVCARCLIADER